MRQATCDMRHATRSGSRGAHATPAAARCPVSLRSKRRDGTGLLFDARRSTLDARRSTPDSRVSEFRLRLDNPNFPSFAAADSDRKRTRETCETRERRETRDPPPDQQELRNLRVASRNTIMEQIETQASDLRYLAQAPVPVPVPVALSDTASVLYDHYESPRPQPHRRSPGAPPGSAAVGDNSAAAPGSASANANKRRTTDDAAAQRQTRSKRNRVSWLWCLLRV
ncbi:hypothetical protein E4U43_004169 [Claviceps pusilla]|uniref:Uncharacterized protein n=1 Tax=Claviceps pusilla TaxID=123648 RepID=A0A9P7NH42_9HYPO|nr:hypothetical protein E4U43_004169 [Claviceps pusilla]